MNRLSIFNIQKYCVHDGPGIRTIVFFKGCPLSCQWCSNPESQKFEPELLLYPDKCIGCGKCAEVCESGCFSFNEENKIVFDRTKCTQCCKCTEVCYAGSRHKSVDFMTLEEVKKEVDKDMIYYKQSGGGITFSGGEAMCFSDAVYELAKYYKEEKGVSTAIETCGFVEWDNFEKVLPYMDLVMYDLKILDDEKHVKFTGVSNKKILENLKKVSKKVTTIVRIPIIPTINDSEKDINDFCKFLGEMRGDIDTIHILPYHNLGSNKYMALGRKYLLDDLTAPSDEHMNRIKTQLQECGFKVNIGG